MVNGLKDNYTTALIITVLREITINEDRNLKEIQKTLRISSYNGKSSVYCEMK